jgi:dipeptidyl aminopeptidase/acylaminoacyl peptidase
MAWLPHKSGLVISGAKTNAIELWRLSLQDMELRQVTERVASYNDLGITDDASQLVASQVVRISDLWVGTNRDPQSLKKTVPAMDVFCWTPDGRLVYSSSAAGNVDLWMMRPDGTGQRQLTVNGGGNIKPAVTSDGRYIVFISTRSGESQVWRMNPDGSDQIQLTGGAGANFPAISSDDKWVFYSSTDNWHLWKVPIDGGEPIPVTQYFAAYPSVSPDGRTIACLGRNESKSELLLIPFDGGQPFKRIDVAGGSFSGWRIKWAPDGKSLMYAANRNGPNRPGATTIIKQPLDGGPFEQIASFDEDELFDFEYSVDERFLAVTRGGWQHDAVLIRGLNLY